MYITPAADLPASGRPGNGRPESGENEFNDLFACLMVLTGEAEDRCDLISLGSAQLDAVLPDDKWQEDRLADSTESLYVTPTLPVPDIASVSAPTVMERGQSELTMQEQTSPTSLISAVADKSDFTAREAKEPLAKSEGSLETAPPEPATTEPLPTNASPAEVTASVTPMSLSELTAPGSTLRPAIASSLLPGTAGTAEWQHSLNQQISAFIREGVHHAELRLQPESLGPIRVSLRVDNEQVEVSFIAPHAQTREALESALPLLRHTLSASGLALGESQVSGEKSDASHLSYDRGKQPPRPGKIVDLPENIPLESLHPGSEYGLSYSRVNIFV